ncbi:NAD-dependent epimerase/dehydratase family protein [Nibrella saemangeumensis]|uniref:NAD-dependent epimerase/dehydratase family protein n=1 Tax=Nibrella saemangeumensis TaxID=1084526 RepID=A0ABP8MNI7_9BACT
MPTVLLTGANGFLGSHLARELLKRHYTVRTFVRPGSDSRTLMGLPLEFAEGDIRRAADVAAAARPCDYIIHAAALAQINPARSPDVWHINLNGTENVLSAADKAKVQRLVYVGTANVFGFGSQSQPGNETRPYAGYQYGLDYMDSKHAATQLVAKSTLQWGMPVVSVHPTFMLGPLDAKPTSNAMLLELYRGRVPAYTGGGKNYVHVRDVAVATVNALTQGRNGEHYILGNENLSYREAFQLMAEVMLIRPPRIRIPDWLALRYGRLCDLKTQLTGKPALVNSAMMKVAIDGHYFSVNKARQELSLPATPIRLAVQEAFNWFVEQGYLDKVP